MDNDFNNNNGFETQQQNVNGEYHFNQQQYRQQYTDAYEQTTPVNTYSTSTGYYYPPKPHKVKKEKKRIGIGALIACCLVCALISGVVSSAGVAFYMSRNITQVSEGGTSQNTVINVDKTATNVVSAVAQKVTDSVVGISASVSSKSNDPYYYFFYGDESSSSEGSGVIISNDGYIVTNYHVISNAITASSNYTSQINVYLATDPETAITASVVGYDSSIDLAVLKIDKTGLTAIDYADSDELAVGDTAIAIGCPGGLDFMSSVSSGIISGLDRTIQLEGTGEMTVIQTDAAINPGNSGGALVNASGELIGINSSKISSEAYEGMGFAIPSNKVKEICDNIIDNKDKKYAYVGISINNAFTSDMLQMYGYPSGAVVQSVESGSPAENAGIKSKDIITEFNGVEISSADEYNEQRLKYQPGEQVTLTVYRSGRYYNVKITLGESSN